MNYLYYPGCSLEGTASEYDRSTRALMGALGVDLTEIPDWTCCGASAAEAADHLLALALPGRNLAIAEKMGGSRDILVPCSACYLNLKKVEDKIKSDPAVKERLNAVLSAEGLHLQGKMHTRHLLDVLAQDLTAGRIKDARKRDLSQIAVAPYYGCQCLRPYAVFDDPEVPQSMQPLIEATGALTHSWHMGGKCCGAAHMNTKPKVGMQLVAAILREAKEADVVVTVCPMCQLNLEAFQKQISKHFNEDFNTTILYLPQFLGLALGISEKDLGLHLNLAVTPEFREKIASSNHIGVAYHDQQQNSVS